MSQSYHGYCLRCCHGCFLDFVEDVDAGVSIEPPNTIVGELVADCGESYVVTNANSENCMVPTLTNDSEQSELNSESFECYDNELNCAYDHETETAGENVCGNKDNSMVDDDLTGCADFEMGRFGCLACKKTFRLVHRN